jgi:large subunit ribosomal protein L15
MKIHELQTNRQSKARRVGRGIGSGRGKTAGRGTKGQNARTGGGVRLGFEGGQNPLAKRLPKKRGFTPLSRVRYQVVNIEQLEVAFQPGQNIDAKALQSAGLIKDLRKPVKLLGQGELSHKLTAQVQAASKSAKAAIDKAGGTVVVEPLPKRTSAASKSKPQT